MGIPHRLAAASVHGRPPPPSCRQRAPPRVPSTSCWGPSLMRVSPTAPAGGPVTAAPPLVVPCRAAGSLCEGNARCGAFRGPSGSAGKARGGGGGGGGGGRVCTSVHRQLLGARRQCQGRQYAGDTPPCASPRNIPMQGMPCAGGFRGRQRRRRKGARLCTDALLPQTVQRHAPVRPPPAPAANMAFMPTPPPRSTRLLPPCGRGSSVPPPDAVRIRGR